MALLKDPEPIKVFKFAATVVVDGSVVPVVVPVVVLVDGLMAAVTTIDPLCTPTTLTLEVSTMFSKAHRLLIKLVMVLLLRKKSLAFKAK